jgi:hypothetical protein
LASQSTKGSICARRPASCCARASALDSVVSRDAIRHALDAVGRARDRPRLQRESLSSDEIASRSPVRAAFSVDQR